MIARFRVRTLQTKTDFFLFLVNYTFDNTDPEFGSQKFLQGSLSYFYLIFGFFLKSRTTLSVKCTKVQKTLLG